MNFKIDLLFGCIDSEIPNRLHLNGTECIYKALEIHNEKSKSKLNFSDICEFGRELNVNCNIRGSMIIPIPIELSLKCKHFENTSTIIVRVDFSKFTDFGIKYSLNYFNDDSMSYNAELDEENILKHWEFDGFPLNW